MAIETSEIIGSLALAGVRVSVKGDSKADAEEISPELIQMIELLEATKEEIN